VNVPFKQQSEIALQFSALLLALFNTGHIAAQQSTVNPLPPGAIKLPAGTLPIDPAKLTASISESYYHPDDLSGLDCKVSVDWSSLLNGLKAADAEKRLKILQSITIHSQANRDKRVEVTFDWGTESLDTKEQLENGLKQMIGGFYQMY
jgi:hypothetical protein